MSQSQYIARWLCPDDARVTYPLLRLRRPELGLKTWNESLQRAVSKRTGTRMVGVFNASGCVLALYRVQGLDIEMLAGPPALLGNHAALAEAAQTLVRPLETV